MVAKHPQAVPGQAGKVAVPGGPRHKEHPLTDFQTELQGKLNFSFFLLGKICIFYIYTYIIYVDYLHA